MKTNAQELKFRRETRNGREVIIAPSQTLPDDIVMNGLLYPADEIEASFMTLERTPAPLGHPMDEAGDFLSASDPAALNTYYVGAHNENVTRANGIVNLDKVIDVAFAEQSEGGRRLLNRIEEQEPISTSTGLYLIVEELNSPQVNAKGQPYQMIAREMVFDHDAILLDEAPAATSESGVGVFVNRQTVNELSFDEIRDKLYEAFRASPYIMDWISVVYPSRVVYEARDMYFEVPYVLDGDTAIIMGIPLPVDREVVYTVKNEGKPMNTQNPSPLKDQPPTVPAPVAPTPTTHQPASNSEQLMLELTKQVASLATQVGTLTSTINQTNSEHYEKAAKILNLPLDQVQKLDLTTVKNVCAKATPGYGIPGGEPDLTGNSTDTYKMPA